MSSKRPQRLQTSESAKSLDDNEHANPTVCGIEMKGEHEDSPYGWGRLQPSCLQGMRSVKWFLFWICWAGALQGMIVNGFVNVVITTVEKRFSLSGAEAGLIASCYDIASVICALPVSYFGANAHRPRWLALGTIVMGIGAFVTSLPHFLTARYEPSVAAVNGSDSLCVLGGNATDVCDEADASLRGYKYVFYLGQLLHGAGASPFYTLGIAFLDDNVRPKLVSLYVGIYYTMALLGPALGYMLGGLLLAIYTDAPSVDPADLGLTPQSSAWVGAWWIGFFICSFICWLAAIPMLGYSRELPGAAAARAERISEVHKKGDDDEVTRSGFGTSFRDIPIAFTNLLRNPTFMFLNLAGATEGMLVAGFATFMPKYVQFQFALTASFAAILMGFIVVPAGGGGTFLGGYIIKKLQMNCEKIVRFCAIVCMSAVPLTLAFLVQCPQGHIGGFNAPYLNCSLLTEPNVTAACNIDCGCQSEQYSPICGIDGVTYYSACYAGCTTTFTENGTKQKLAVTTRNVFFFRCVAPTQRAFALGNQWLYIRLLGTIPAPVIFGSLIDMTCSWWSDNCDEESSGSCYFYDNHQMSMNMLAMAIVGKSASTLFFFLSWFLYQPPSPHDDTVGMRSVKTDERSLTNPNYDASASNLDGVSRASSGYETGTAVTLRADSDGDIVYAGVAIIGNGDATRANGAPPPPAAEVTRF
ncbi:PREDICTED: solute carrier organic anion transporter family member 4A1-like [Priapulus caudatus]|uniref:Solute carrier organic anion transporter family member n=1 Tax=Priapulus caudatus TaxID=37621 RepID=A0ABM1DQF8_PRICU|nr:PREDICTED: solute carrier organic anion transporter family member 4A1-like [Priapulus caudatus]